MGGRRRNRKSGQSAKTAPARRRARSQHGPGPSLLQRDIRPADRQLAAQLVMQALRGGVSIAEGRTGSVGRNSRSEKQRVEPL